MEFIFAMALRGGLSFLLGLLFGFVGLAFFSSIIPPYWDERLTLVALCVGISIGSAAAIAWLKPESSGSVIATSLALAFGVAILASFAGYIYAGVFDIQVRNDLLISRGSATSSAIWAFAIGCSTVASTTFGALYYGFRLWRYHEV